MNIGLNLGYICRERKDTPVENIDKAMDTAIRAGFRHFDFLSDVEREDYLAHAEDIRARAEKKGAVIHQTHAPYNRYNRDRSDADFRVLLDRAVTVTKILGAPYMAVHADEYRLAPDETYDKKKIGAAMYEYFAPIVEKANNSGVTVAIENLFEDHAYGPRSRYTSDIDEVLYLLERFGKGTVCCCWDSGHARVSFREKTYENFLLVAPWIGCTHIHDNIHMDEHLLPYLGEMDLAPYVRHLKEIGYRGEMTYELVYGHVPAPLFDEYMTFCYHMAEYLVKQ